MVLYMDKKTGLVDKRFLSTSSNLFNKIFGLLIILSFIEPISLDIPLERILLYSKRATPSFGI
jgi:hypothetical protein